MRHQVERLKHVALRQGVKPARALTATLVAIGMMAAAAISFVPTGANADSGKTDGSLCTPQTIGLGDNTSDAKVDSGVATYVGRDLYVGKNTGSKTNISNENDVDGSYAVEAEGLTVVNGKLVMRPLKDSWKAPDSTGKYYSAGFRWGTVGFGSQFRPDKEKTVLAIGGTDSGINTLTSGSVQGTVGAYGKGGFVGQSYTQWDKSNGYQPVTKSAQGYKYKASIAGSETKWSTNTRRSSIVAAQGDWNNPADGDVKFNASNPLKNVNGTDYTNYTKAYLKSKLSEPLSKLRSTQLQVKDPETAPEGTVTRYKYNYDKTTDPVSFKFTYNGGSTTVDNLIVRNNEKLITFSGDGVSAMQVFNIKGTDLSSAGYRGVDFKFDNIPDKASVVVNVDGSNIDFHTGWRFWWGDTEIGGGFSQKETDKVRELYSSAAQKIMWNFKDATNVTIRGGVANEGTADNKLTTDDPAAAMLGSILVPNGSFESHVSTNGRVYVGQDFMMYNPTAIAYENDKAGWEGKTASVLNMDQERHNLPWNGQLTTSCSTIQWSKVDTSSNPLGGTTWAVYGTKNNAVATPATPLTTITDNGWNDGNDADGEFSLTGLTANATYYIKETSTGSADYQLNENVYRIDTGAEGASSASIAAVYDKNGNEITDESAKTLLNGKIVNKKRGSSLAWSKVDADSTDTKLAGSTWNLTKYTDEARTNVEEGWPKSIEDNTVKVTGVAIKDLTTGAEYSDGQDLGEKAVNNVFRLSATVAPSGAPSGVVWSSSNDYYATVDAGSGIVTPKSNSGNDYVSITACSTSNADVCASVKFKVTGATAAKVSVSPSPATVVEGKTTQLTATVNPQQDVSWSSNNELVAKVDQNGLVTGVSAGTATITASTANGTFDSVTVTVTSSKQYLTLYFDSYKQGSWSANNVQVHYRLNDNVTWADQDMTQMSGSCGQYAYARILMDEISVDSQFGFRTKSGQGWYGPGNANVPKSNGNFKFTSEATIPENVTISAGPNYSPTAPSGCVASSASVQSSKSSKVVRKAAKVATQVSGAGRLANAAQSELIDEDTDPGAFRISNLADGYYVLKETGEPNGFDIGGEYKITIQNGKVTWDPDKDGTKLSNTRKTGMVTWNKVDKTDGAKLLGGSEWTLTQTKNFSWVNGKASYTEANKELATITDCVDSDSSATQCDVSTEAYADIDGKAGQFSIKCLAWGEYQLVETKAPDGYDLDSTPHTFRFGPAEGSDVTGEWYTSSGFKTDTTSAYDANTAFTVDGGSITNTPGVVLPDTGGEGVNKMYTAGFLAVAIAVAGLALSLRRRQS